MKASAPALKAMRPAKFRKAGALPQLNQPPCTGVHSLVLPETRTLREAESAGLCTLQADQNVWGGVRPNLQPGCGRKRFRDRGNFQKIGECQAGEDSPVDLADDYEGSCGHRLSPRCVTAASVWAGLSKRALSLIWYCTQWPTTIWSMAGGPPGPGKVTNRSW